MGLNNGMGPNGQGEWTAPQVPPMSPHNPIAGFPADAVDAALRYKALQQAKKRKWQQNAGAGLPNEGKAPSIELPLRTPSQDEAAALSHAAQQLPRHGYALTPLVFGTKKPWLGKWNAMARAIRDTVTAGRFAADADGSNWGVVLYACRMCTLDIDDLPKARELFQRFNLDLDAFLTSPGMLRSRSGKPNREKLWFSLPSDVDVLLYVELLECGIEFRCACQVPDKEHPGRWVNVSQQDMVPPSVHPDTDQSICWVQGFDDWQNPPTLPPEILAMWRALHAERHSRNTKTPHTATTGSLVQATTRTGELKGSPRGRNQQLASLLGTLWNNPSITEADLLAAALAINATKWGPPDEIHGLTVEEVTGTAESIAKRERHSDPRLEALLNQLLADEEAAHPPILDTRKLGIGMYAAPPVDFLLEHWIPFGDVTLFAANGGTGKTFLALIWLVHVAFGKRWANLLVRQCKAGFLSLEDGERVLNYRLDFILTDYETFAASRDPEQAAASPETINGMWGLHEAVHENMVIMDGSLAATELMREKRDSGTVVMEETLLLKMIEGMLRDGLKFLIIDNATLAFAGDENDGREVSRFIRRLRQLAAETGAAILLIAHAAKGATQQGPNGGNPFRGVAAWFDGVRSALAMFRTGNNVTLHQFKSNHGYVQPPMALAWISDPTPGVVNRGQLLVPTYETVEASAGRGKVVGSMGPELAQDEVLAAIRGELTAGANLCPLSSRFHSQLKARLPPELRTNAVAFREAYNALLDAGVIEQWTIWRDSKEYTQAFTPHWTLQPSQGQRIDNADGVERPKRDGRRRRSKRPKGGSAP